MDILLRLADQENGYDNKGYKSFVQTALLLANDNKWVELDASLSTLEERFPLLQPTIKACVLHAMTHPHKGPNGQRTISINNLSLCQT